LATKPETTKRSKGCRHVILKPLKPYFTQGPNFSQHVTIHLFWKLKCHWHRSHTASSQVCHAVVADFKKLKIALWCFLWYKYVLYQDSKKRPIMSYIGKGKTHTAHDIRISILVLILRKKSIVKSKLPLSYYLMFAFSTEKV
jgi:hypothetical protein